MVFENKTGESRKMSKKVLEAMLPAEKFDLDLVFIAACKSEFCGEVFSKFGAKHVIFVDKKIADVVAIYFCQNFYPQVFCGIPICKAFAVAKKQTEHRYPGEVNMLKMFV